MKYKWIGPKGGLGNRILALGSVLALSKIMQSTITFPWRVNSYCPANYNELFEEMPGIVIDNSLSKDDRLIGTIDWDPILIYQEFQKEINHNIALEEYCVFFIEAMRSLKYKKSILNELKSYYDARKNNNNFAIHIRRTDRIKFNSTFTLAGLFSTKRHKRELSRHILRYDTGIWKTLQYSLFPKRLFIYLENRQLAKACTEFLLKDNNSTYSVYADSKYGLLSLQKQIQDLGIPDNRYIPSYCHLPDTSSWGTFGKRHTSIKDALIELVGMSMSAGILQNLSASTFSICSSIIGGTPILTSQPKHLFWKVIRETLGKYPYEI